MLTPEAWPARPARPASSAVAHLALSSGRHGQHCIREGPGDAGGLWAVELRPRKGTGVEPVLGTASSTSADPSGYIGFHARDPALQAHQSGQQGVQGRRMRWVQRAGEHRLQGDLQARARKQHLAEGHRRPIGTLVGHGVAPIAGELACRGGGGDERCAPRGSTLGPSRDGARRFRSQLSCSKGDRGPCDPPRVPPTVQGSPTCPVLPEPKALGARAHLRRRVLQVHGGIRAEHGALLLGRSLLGGPRGRGRTTGFAPLGLGVLLLGRTGGRGPGPAHQGVEAVEYAGHGNLGRIGGPAGTKDCLGSRARGSDPPATGASFWLSDAQNIWGPGGQARAPGSDCTQIMLRPERPARYLTSRPRHRPSPVAEGCGAPAAHQTRRC